MHRLYKIFYFLVYDDGTNTVHSRTRYLLEIFLSLLFIACTEIILGISNLRLGNFFYYVIVMLPSPIVAYCLVQNRFNDEKGKEVVRGIHEQVKKRKRDMVFLAIGLFIVVFTILVLSGMLMSFLFR